MTEEKLKSRKFSVWIVWLILTLCVIIFCAVSMIVSKTVSDSLTGLIEKVLGWFFAVSMMYLGMNVSQKLGFSLSDALKNKNQNEEE